MQVGKSPPISLCSPIGSTKQQLESKLSIATANDVSPRTAENLKFAALRKPQAWCSLMRTVTAPAWSLQAVKREIAEVSRRGSCLRKTSERLLPPPVMLAARTKRRHPAIPSVEQRLLAVLWGGVLATLDWSQCLMSGCRK